MTLARTAATNGRYKNNNPLPWDRENNLEPPKQAEGVSSLLDYGFVLGSVDQENSGKIVETIHHSNFLDNPYQLPNWLSTGISWEARKELLPFSETKASPTTDVVEEIYANIILGEIFTRLEIIAQREDDWDGLGSMRPNEISLGRAGLIMMKLLDSVISNEDEWIDPYICSDEDGYVTVEWTGGKRQLYLRIEEDEVEYITLERITTKRKMGGDTIRGDDCFEIWKWLINGQQ